MNNIVSNTDVQNQTLQNITKSFYEQADTLNYPQESFKYIGDRYAYTGTSSPILAYYHAISDGDIVSEDVLIFCSVGASTLRQLLCYI